MTEAVYLEATTAREFEAKVDRVVDNRVVLDRTLFYPTGGGQPHDTGQLRTPDDAEPFRVLDVQKKDTIYHTLNRRPPSDGTTITGTIDWDRRAAHMRYHTAQHLLSAVLLELFDAPTTGNQLYEDRARIDCAYDRFEANELSRIETRMNELIEEGRNVEWYTIDRATAEATLDPQRTRLDLLPASIDELRIVEIDGYDRTACAGTHVASTAECGAFTLDGRETKGANEERLRFTLKQP